MSLAIPSHKHAPNQGGRTPGSQTPGVPATPEPSMTKNSSSSSAHLVLNPGTTGGARKCGKTAEKPVIAAITTA